MIKRKKTLPSREKKVPLPDEEMEKRVALWWRELPLSSEVIGIYGIDTPSIYIHAKEWLKEEKNRYLCLVEDRASYWKKLARSSIYSLMEEDPRVKLFFIESLLEQVSIAQEMVEYFFGLTIAWVPSFSYRGSEKFESFQSMFATLHQAHGYILQEDEKEKHAQNVYHNIIKTDFFVDTHRFSHIFKDIPAIICGASPSLSTHFSFLKEVNHHAFIFAGGSSIGSFSRNGIPFHMGASVDPEAPLDRFMQISSFEVPFSYQNLMAKENLYRVHAPTIWGGTGGSYPLEDAVCGQLGFSTSSIPWCTVSSYLLNQALLWGCNPIIFAGMDYCFEHDRYDAGIRGGEEKEQSHKLITVKNESGRVVFTQEDWLVDKRYIEKRIQENSDRQFFRLGKDGLSIEGATYLSHEECYGYLGKQKDLFSLLHHMLQKNKEHLDPSRVHAIFDAVEKSRKTCLSYMEDLVLAPEKLKTIIPFLEKEIFYQSCLNFPWKSREKMFLREVRALGLPWEPYLSSLRVWFYMDRIKRHANIFTEVANEGIPI